MIFVGGYTYWDYVQCSQVVYGEAGGRKLDWRDAEHRRSAEGVPEGAGTAMMEMIGCGMLCFSVRTYGRALTRCPSPIHLVPIRLAGPSPIDTGRGPVSFCHVMLK